MTIAYYGLILLLLVQVVFQALLAAGKPWGKVAWGGTYSGVLPHKLRRVSGLVALVYLLVVTILMQYALIGAVFTERGFNILLWCLLVFFTLGTVLNLLSPSRPERIWAVYTLTAAGCIAALLLG